jgi:tetratricopeptide (TPR) repeat protein
VNNDDAHPSSTLTTTPAGLPGALTDDFDIDVVDGLSGRQRVAARRDDGTPARPVADRLPLVSSERGATARTTDEDALVLRARVDALRAEARGAAASDLPRAAPLWFAAGRILDVDLGEAGAAAACYEAAFRSDPGYLPALRAARGLLGSQGLWRAVLLLLDAEERVPGVSVAALRIEKARLLEGRLGRAADALAEYQRVLRDDPAHPVAVDAIVRALTREQRPAGVVDVLIAAADACTRPALQAAWLIAAGHLCETRLGDDARALAVLERAAALDPGRRSLLETLRRLHARRGASDRLSEVLEQLATSASTAAEAVAWWIERTRVLLGENDPVRRADAERAALVSLEQARARAPTDPTVLDELSRLYERRADWAALADTLEARAEGAQDLRSRADLLGDAARIAEDRLGDQERAIRLYRRSAELDPENTEVLASLGRLFARTQRFEDLSLVYDQQIQALNDAQQKVPLLFKQAELLANTLDDPVGALTRLQELLDVVPGDVAAVRLAASLCTQLERWGELVELWEAQIGEEDSSLDRASRLFLLQKIADVHEDRLADIAAAAATYERMLHLEPGYLPALRKLARLYASLERWDDVLRVNAIEAATVDDRNVVVSLWFRNGELLAEKLGRTESAIDAFQQALAVVPTYVPALKALGGIYARSGRWPDLLGMHRQEARAATSRAHRVHLLFQIAQITLDKLCDIDGAVQAFQDVLREDPTHHASLHALERIARQRNDAVAVLAAHERALAITEEPLARAQLRCRIAEHLESALGRTEEAIETLELALREDPTLLTAHEQLITMLSRHGRPEEEAAARERVHERLPDVPARRANLRSLLSLAQNHLDDIDRAADAARRLLTLAAGDRSALRALLACALRRRDIPAAIHAAESLVAVEPSVDEVVNLHLQLAGWREFDLLPPADPLPDWLRILEFQPNHPIAVHAVEQAYIRAGAWQALFSLYELQTGALVDPALVVDNAMKMAHLAEARLERLDVARSCYERALAAVRDHLPAISRLKDLYGREGRPQDQLRLMALEAETSRDPEHAVQTLFDVGVQQRDRFGELDAAADCFQRVLAREPRHSGAQAALEALWTQQGRFADLARLHERTAAALGTDASATAERISLLVRAAQIHHERLGHVDDAARLLDQVTAMAPEDPTALFTLGQVRGAREDWDGALAAFEALLARTSDPVEASRIHLQIGTILVGPKNDGARAVAHLRSVLETQPGYRPAQTLLARAFELAGAPVDALALWSELLPAARNDGERRSLHLSLARLAETAGEPARAAQHVDALLALTVEGDEARSLFERACRLHEQAGDTDAMIATTLRRADGLVASDPSQAVGLLLRAARLQAAHSGNLDTALATARRALDLEPEHVETRLFLAEAYGGLPNQQILAVEENRRVVRSGQLRIEALRGMYRAWSQQRAFDRCFCAAEALSFLSAAEPAEEEFYVARKKQQKRLSREQLQPGQVTSWLAHPAQRNAVRDVLVACGSDLARIFAIEPPEDVDRRFVLRPRAEDPLRTLADNVALSLGVSGFDVWRSQARRTGVDLYPGSTSVVLVGQDVTRTHQVREQRFLLGRRLMALQSGHHILHDMDARYFGLLLSAIGRSQDKNYPRVGTVDDDDAFELETLARQVGGALSRRTRAQLEGPLQQLAASASTVDLEAHLRARSFSERRAGLVLSGALDVAVRLVARDLGVSLSGNTASLLQTIEAHPALLDLFVFGLSDEYFLARQALKLAIDT